MYEKPCSWIPGTWLSMLLVTSSPSTWSWSKNILFKYCVWNSRSKAKEDRRSRRRSIKATGSVDEGKTNGNPSQSHVLKERGRQRAYQWSNEWMNNECCPPHCRLLRRCPDEQLGGLSRMDLAFRAFFTSARGQSSRFLDLCTISLSPSLSFFHSIFPAAVHCSSPLRTVKGTDFVAVPPPAAFLPTPSRIQSSNVRPNVARAGKEM